MVLSSTKIWKPWRMKIQMPHLHIEIRVYPDDDHHMEESNLVKALQHHKLLDNLALAGPGTNLGLSHNTLSGIEKRRTTMRIPIAKTMVKAHRQTHPKTNFDYATQ